MAGPTPSSSVAPPTSSVAKVDAALTVEPQPLYVAPSVLTKPLAGGVSNQQVMPPAQPLATERVEAPPPHTLAHGRYEAKPATIWLLVAAAALMLLLWALFRVRVATAEKKKKHERLTTLKKPATSSK